jgi:mitochondrial chaperone BCS1
MDQILHALQEALSNQFLSGGLVLGIVGSVIALCRQLPGKFFAWLKRRLIVTVDVTNDDPIFEWLSLWLAKHPYSQRARCLTAKSRRNNNGRIDTDNTDGLPDVVFTPAPGNHFFIYERRLVWLSRERKDVNADKAEEFFSRLHRETYQIRLLGRKQAIIRSLIEKARCLAMEARDVRVEVFTVAYGSWYRSGLREMRPLSTVILPDHAAQDIAEDVREFRASEEWYRDRGIPYRRGYLFYGVPGSGKTSLITALAGEFRAALYVLNLGDPQLTDSKILTLLSEAKAGGFILLEDLDAAFAQRDKGKDSDNGVTFSGLLNALNGAATPEGTLVFMTTNHKDALDPALIRPGRADVHLKFDYATREQAYRLFKQFFPAGDAALANKFADSATRQLTMAQIQGHLLQHKNSPDDAVRFSRLEAAA